MTDFRAMRVCWFQLAYCFFVLLAFSVGATHKTHAQPKQFVLVDATFTATGNNTSSSEYALAPVEGAPSNWRMPVDFASGRIHVRTQVLEKPSAMKTLTNVCFKEADVLTCMPYPDAYTKPGVYESEPEISKFWQYDVYDWTKKVERVNVVVKDENGRFVQGDPSYFPTKLHVTVTVIPAGEKYVAPDGLSDGDMDAGVASVPGEPARSRNATEGPAVAGSTSAPPFSGRGSAGAAPAGVISSAGRVAPVPSAAVDAGAPHDIREFIESGSACAVVHPRPSTKARYGVGVSIGVFALSLWQITRMGLGTRRNVTRVRSRGRQRRRD